MGGEFLLRLNTTCRPILKPSMGKDPATAHGQAFGRSLQPSSEYRTDLRGLALLLAVLWEAVHLPIVPHVARSSVIKGVRLHPGPPGSPGPLNGDGAGLRQFAGVGLAFGRACARTGGGLAVHTNVRAVSLPSIPGAAHSKLNQRGVAALAGSPVLKHGPRSQACMQGEGFLKPGAEAKATA